MSARGERLLPHFDRDVGIVVQRELEKKGHTVITDRRVVALERGRDRIAVEFDDGRRLPAERVLFAIERNARTSGPGLDRVGVRCEADGAIACDDEYRTSVPSIRAIGDVLGHVQRTPVALAEATALARTLFGAAGPVRVDHRAIPTAVFTIPEVAAAGLAEAQARGRFENVVVFETDVRPLEHSLSRSPERASMKLVVDGASDRVLGVLVLGAMASEIVQSAAVAPRCGATKADFDRTIGIHPTRAEELVTLRTPREARP